MGKSSQVKGRRGEIELAALLQQHGYDVRPGTALSYGTEPDLVGLPMIHCEVKRCEKLRLSEWLKQAQQDSEKFGGLPSVFFRKSREGWNVVMPLTAWLELYAKTTCRCGGRCKDDRKSFLGGNGVETDE